MAVRKKSIWGRFLFFGLLGVFIAVGAIALYNILSVQRDYTSASSEYDGLRQFAPGVMRVTGESFEAAQPEASGQAAINLSDINPDYIGWIHVGNSPIDYPIVQGEDNEKYLTTTFTGTENPSGAIFLDVACAGGLDSAAALLYGHNMNDGSMFASLNEYVRDGFPAEAPEIEITTLTGETRHYYVLSSVVTDIYDEAFTLSAQGPEEVRAYLSGRGMPDADNLLILSTCTDGPDDERVLVFAAAA